MISFSLLYLLYFILLRAAYLLNLIIEFILYTETLIKTIVLFEGVNWFKLVRIKYVQRRGGFRSRGICSKKKCLRKQIKPTPILTIEGAVYICKLLNDKSIPLRIKINELAQNRFKKKKSTSADLKFAKAIRRELNSQDRRVFKSQLSKTRGKELYEELLSEYGTSNCSNIIENCQCDFNCTDLSRIFIF